MFITLFLKSLGKRFAQSNKQFSNADHLSASLCALCGDPTRTFPFTLYLKSL